MRQKRGTWEAYAWRKGHLPRSPSCSLTPRATSWDGEQSRSPERIDLLTRVRGPYLTILSAPGSVLPLSLSPSLGIPSQDTRGPQSGWGLGSVLVTVCVYSQHSGDRLKMDTSLEVDPQLHLVRHVLWEISQYIQQTG